MTLARPSRPHLILASGSRTRRDMLKAAGVFFSVQTADVDEVAMRDALAAEHGDDIVPPEDVAEILACAKAEAVSAAHPDALVIGADQVLELEGEIFAKPADMEAAREQLLRLRGRAHKLHSAVAIAKAGDTLWAHLDTAELAMRDFSPRFLDDYLAAAGDKVATSVGAYQIEGLGVQLFERVDGGHFTILGMPLLPLLTELRRIGAVAT
ncbi:MAG: Maf family protein [Hyphomicrobiaceae bacterium]|nr:Maf family protein [Hyphomicrobiaceae bacterium]